MCLYGCFFIVGITCLVGVCLPMEVELYNGAIFPFEPAVRVLKEINELVNNNQAVLAELFAKVHNPLYEIAPWATPVLARCGLIDIESGLITDNMVSTLVYAAVSFNTTKTVLRSKNPFKYLVIHGLRYHL